MFRDYLLLKNRDRVDVPDFDVHTNSTTYKVGDTVTFEFSGNPQNIVYWSGMPGSNYEYKEPGGGYR